MKQYLLFFSIFITSGVYSQVFTGGVTAGVVASQVAGDTYSGYNKAGATGGGWVNLSISSSWALQMEIDYVMKGSRHLSNPDKNDFNTYKLNLSYIEVPFLAQYKMKGMTVEFGLAGAVLVSKMESMNGDDWTNLAGRPGFRTQNFSFLLGFQVPLNDRFNVGLRTSNSINSIRIGQTSGFVKRLGSGYGQFHDLLMLSVFYRL